MREPSALKYPVLLTPLVPACHLRVALEKRVRVSVHMNVMVRVMARVVLRDLFLAHSLSLETHVRGLAGREPGALNMCT
jgi:hypothetical protein